MELSVVIPTRNRPESLLRLLRSLLNQSFPLKEVIIVDSSDSPFDAKQFTPFKSLNIRYLNSSPSVCAQRNLGIRLASSENVFLCDDDIELTSDYLGILCEFLAAHPEEGAACGVILEPEGENSQSNEFPSISFSHLLWRFVFQLGVFADLRKTRAHFVFAPFLSLLRAFYRHRGNTFTFAGWPLVTQVNRPWFKTALSALGCSVVKRDWLLNSPFNERLDPSGIGDNYGVAIGFPGKQPITIMTSASVIHHRSPLNRSAIPLAYFRRILALDYFMSQSRRFHSLQRIFLCWSLAGNLLAQLMRGELKMAGATFKAFGVIAQNGSPYTRAFVKEEKGSISPELTLDSER